MAAMKKERKGANWATIVHEGEEREKKVGTTVRSHRQLSGHSDNCQLSILTLTPSEYKKMLRLIGEGSRWRIGL